MNNQNSSAELVQNLFNKSWDSPDFKNKLIRNPIQTIEDLTGKTANLSRYKKVVVEDQMDEKVIFLNIPAQPDLDELALTEEQLELVSGGILPVVAYATYVAVGFLGTWALDQVF